MKKKIKIILTLVLSLSLCLLLLAGCSGTPPTSSEASPSQVAPSESAPVEASPAETGPAAQEATKVLLVVSFGTSYNDNRELTIGAIEKKLQEASPDYQVRRAFTSQIIIDKIGQRDKLEIDNVTQAMDRLVADGVKELVIQPTHVMNGYEYDDMIAEVTPYQNIFNSFTIGEPLLISDADYDQVVSILAEETKDYNVDGTAIVFMGHGTEHAANATYAKLQERIAAAGHANIFIGTVEGEPELEDAMALVKKSGAAKVVLLPLMIVAGDHANNDMAGDEEDSWKSAFEAENYQVECVLKGMGQYAGIQEMYVRHVADAMKDIAPIYGNQLKDGTYALEVSSSSSMFRVVDAQLTVVGGEMTAVVTLSGTGYEKLYMGTGEEALADTDDKCIYYVEDAEGKYTYTVPVAALDQDINVAAWSIGKQTWYDRVLVFQSSLIPRDAITAQ